jgi:Flp pilus assembly pilin Flp
MLHKMTRSVVKFFTNEEGIQHAEEALLLALIAVASVVAVQNLGVKITDVFNVVDSKMDTTPLP